jgi:hypothetical protein
VQCTGGLTRGNVVVWVDGNVVGNLDEIDGLENGQSLANGGDADRLERVGIEHAEDLAGYAMFWEGR